MANAKDGGILLDYFGRSYTSRTRRHFVVNRAKEKWAARDLVDSYGLEECKRLIDRYFKTAINPQWKTFVYNAQNIQDAMIAEELDKKQRVMLNRQAQEWIEKYG